MRGRGKGARALRQVETVSTVHCPSRANPAGSSGMLPVSRKPRLRLGYSVVLNAAAPVLIVLAGCGGGLVAANPSNTTFSITPGLGAIDTNCTGCNSTGASGGAVERFSATLANGAEAQVTWSVAGGDATSGAGSISRSGQYTPPSYLTGDRAEVVVTATLDADPAVKASAVVTLTPGFLQPLSPENVALGANGTATFTGILAEVGGSTGIRFRLANAADWQGAASGVALGSLAPANCRRGGQAFTSCTVTYSAPNSVSATTATYVVATVDQSSSKAAAVVLVNAAGVSSNPASHQVQAQGLVQLGSSGGNNGDYDTQGNQIVDCCSGTLGALIQDSSNNQYLLSNNHVLARSDHAAQGDPVVQPGLIDNNCTPSGEGPGVAPVASLAGWLSLGSKQTNADAAIALVASHSVDSSGSILELGGRQPDGTLAAAPPGISSSGGKGEAAALDLKVAKSGRTTGLTCGGISALDLDVTVDYYLDCAETEPYLTKTFTHQLAISGNQFSDSGDSGALVVDSANAEPVGLYFAGGTDSSGVSQGVASPAGDVLSELGGQTGGNYTFVGAADHPVSCLSYGNSTIASAQGRTLSDVEMARGQLALADARLLVNPTLGILGVATGKSSDRAGEAAILVYTDEGMTVSIPSIVGGVRTAVIPTTAHAVAVGSAPQTAFEAGLGSQALPAAALNAAVAIKQRNAASLMKLNPAFFGVGVGQSLDNPREAALVIYVERKLAPVQLPPTVGDLRTRYVVMDRLHVTRSYAAVFKPGRHCAAHTAPGQ